MSRSERQEYLVGVIAACVLATILVFTALANRRGLDGAANSFRLMAEFSHADGIYIGSAVRLAGLPVGTVIKAVLDKDDHASLTLGFDRPLPIPDDTAAVIETDGVFGAKHIELRPGGAENMLKSGARIDYTQDSVIIGDLIAHIVQQAKGSRGVQ